MKLREAMAELEALGTAQNRKVYGRHGVDDPMYGVSFGNLGKLRRRIRTDHELAEQLWASGNHDARVLATMIADVDRLGARELDAWARSLGNYVVTDAFATMLVEGDLAPRKAEIWTRRGAEFVGRAGWALVARLAGADNELEDAWFLDRLEKIETGIHEAPNRKRETMNTALIAIGCRNARLRQRAEAAARRIGPVEVDHGETSCRTADAIEYIARTWDHRNAKRSKGA
jgi:3-methyladenine DNA glycosylase AlkD